MRILEGILEAFLVLIIIASAIGLWLRQTVKKYVNTTEAYGVGYVAGYNQSRVDSQEMTQQDADDILRKMR
ncbi:MAG: hypothetical protein KAJ19_08825 [Gammaproteobacteria bacterium]|nr:hypothetical protein [Gammaproteobacteria bacterium]